MTEDSHTTLDDGGYTGEEIAGLEAESANLSQVTVHEVKADNVRIHNAMVGSVDAEEVELRKSFVERIYGQNTSLETSAAGLIDSQTAQVQDSVVFLGRINQATLSNSATGGVYAQEVELNESGAALIVARHVRGNLVRSSLLLAGQVESPVETTIDTPRAILLGLAAGVGAGLVLMLGKLISRR